MHIDPVCPATPYPFTQTGLVLTSRLAGRGDRLHVVECAEDGLAFDACALPGEWLGDALDTPLIARTLHLVQCDGGADSLPFLIAAPPDFSGDGFPHLPEATCPATGIVLGVKRLVADIQTEPLRAFLMNVFQRRDVHHAFWTMPASARHHHNGPGGLAVHSLEVAEDIAGHGGLSDLELDLGIAGALLHDIGKVWSYTGDMFPNPAGLAMGHELVGLARLERELATLEEAWPDGAFVMRCLLSGHSRMRANGSLPSSLLPRIKACDQRSCERDRAGRRSSRSSCPVWTPRPWDARASHGDIELP